MTGCQRVEGFKSSAWFIPNWDTVRSAASDP